MLPWDIPRYEPRGDRDAAEDAQVVEPSLGFHDGPFAERLAGHPLLRPHDL